MMLRAIVVALSLVAVLATPPVSRSRREIEEFKNFLESTKTGNGQSIISTVEEDPELSGGHFQGDIILDDWQIEDMVEGFAAGRNAYTWPNTKWPNNVVVWEIGAGEFGPLQTEAIWEGVRDIERRTCVRFRYRTPQDSTFVRVTGGSGGCFAHVGYWQSRGVHTLNLQRNTPGVGCFRHATIVHEWMHILGFLHMHSTHDRDDWVRIATNNVTPSSMHNFDIYGPNLVDNLGIDYDYVSCLQYGPFAFSRNGQQTIIPLRSHQGTMGQREHVTESDWLRINRHYNCPGAWN